MLETDKNIIPNLIWKEDLLWWDGPLISVFSDDQDNIWYFHYHGPTEDKNTQWLAFKTTDFCIELLAENKITMYDFYMLYCFDSYLIECDGHRSLNVINKVFILDQSWFTEYNLPEKGVFLNK